MAYLSEGLETGPKPGYPCIIPRGSIQVIDILNIISSVNYARDCDANYLLISMMYEIR